VSVAGHLNYDTFIRLKMSHSSAGCSRCSRVCDRERERDRETERQREAGKNK
jgi:hypothetical protein